MLTQAQADRLIAALKEAVRGETFVWEDNHGQTEQLVAVEDAKMQFLLFLKRNPFEIRLHLRTRDRDMGLMRLDNARYHPNPDGTEIRDQPHLHVYREGYGLAWAEPVDWCDLTDPVRTLEHFLDVIRTRFPSGLQLSLL